MQGRESEKRGSWFSRFRQRRHRERATGIVFSAFVDNRRKYLLQSFVWAFGLKCFTGIRPDAVHLCMHDDVHQDIVNFFRGHGFQTSSGGTFDKRSLPLNKLNQTSSGALLQATKVVLMDTDMVVSPAINRWIGAEFTFMADHFVARPPIETFVALYANAGLTDRLRYVARPADNRVQNRFPRITVASNLIGSFYAIDSSVYGKVVERWRHYADFCLARIDLIQPNERNIDQIAMAMALDDLNILPALLSPSFSIGPRVSHVPAAPDGGLIDGYHFHDSMDQTAKVLTTDVSPTEVIDFVERINSALNVPEKKSYLELLEQLGVV